MTETLFVGMDELLDVIGYASFVANFYSVKDDIKFAKLYYTGNFITVCLFKNEEMLSPSEQKQFDVRRSSTGRFLYKGFFESAD